MVCHRPSPREPSNSGVLKLPEVAVFCSFHRGKVEVPPLPPVHSPFLWHESEPQPAVARAAKGSLFLQVQTRDGSGEAKPAGDRRQSAACTAAGALRDSGCARLAQLSLPICCLGFLWFGRELGKLQTQPTQP